jgi:eukaryotic-like serine/threonine-protein kinase
VRRAADDLPTLRENAKPSPGERPRDVSPTEASPPSARPQTLGRYRLLFPIARGGMGTVHAAVLKGEAGVGRTFAIKVLRSQDRGAEEVEALVREARLSSMISHPNVLETFELGMFGDEPFIVMPLVKGVTLAKLAAHFSSRHEPFPLRLVASIGAAVAAGLHAAHEATNADGEPLGVVHRDISPQNILLSFDGRVLLLDFGVAKFFEASHATTSGVIKGKFGYMSPEQLRCEPLDRRTDVFALGVVLFELCTGRPLYAHLPPAIATLEIVGEAAPSLGEHASGTTRELGRVLLRALAKSRDERFSSADELREALVAFIKTSDDPDIDLGALLRATFANVRSDLDARLRAALRSPPIADLPDSEPPATNVAESAPATREVAPPRKAFARTALIGGALTCGAALAAGWVTTRVPDAPQPAAAATNSVLAPSASASARPLVSTNVSATPTATSEKAPSVGSARPSNGSAKPTRPAAAPPPEPAPAASVGGQPFRNL